MRAPFRPTSKEVVSQGVAAMRADAFVARTGSTGAGVTVGVLDTSFKGADTLTGSELPGDTQATQTVIDGLGSFGDVHGTACAEIVHDVAPGARLVLANFTDEVTWAKAIDDLAAAGARVISHSVGFDNLFPPDGNHFFGQKVDQAAASGTLFVTAAGNEGANYYQGAWSDTNANGFFEFGPGTELLAVAGSRVVLRWDDAFGASSHDYDLLLVTSDFASNPSLSRDNPAIVAVGADTQQGAGNPREIADVPANETRQLYAVIVHDPASGPPQSSQRFWLWSQAGVDPRFANGSGSLSLPGDARGAVTVGAVAFDSLALEGYSSRGPTADGRVKPDVSAPDQVATASYGGEPFAGTSAATPHAAGAAALLLSRTPSLDQAALRQALERATTSGGGAKDNLTGYGPIDLSRAP
jgi:subtilisin family serine protease